MSKLSNEKLSSQEDIGLPPIQDLDSAEKLVYWDGYGLNHPNSGIFNYARSLAKELIHQGISISTIKSNQSTSCLYKGVSSLTLEPIGSINKRIYHSKLVWPNHVGNYLLKTIGSVSTEKPIYHGLSNSNVPLNGDFFKKFHTVLTIHDLIPLIARKKVSFASYCQFAFYLSAIVKKVDQIVCVSQWTKDHVLNIYPFLSGRVKVIRSGFNDVEFLKRPDKEDSKLNILFVSRYEKYKRFDKLADLIRKYNDRFHLTIITNDIGVKWVVENLKEELEKGFVSVKSQLSLDQLKSEFQNSEVYVHPSEYEGFCLPASEAISFGRPVVFSKGSGIDEVVSLKVGIGLEINCSTLDWASAIEQAHTMSLQKNFNDIIQKTIHEHSSWQEAAKNLLGIYENF